jgi:hypothetical protein
MKLDCPVVRDLHVLYIENELSLEVKDAVMEHLGECEECRKLYTENLGVSQVLNKDINESPSSRLDESMLLKLKIGKLKVGVFVLAIVFFMSVFNYYSSTRYDLNYDLSRTVGLIGNIWQSTDINQNTNFDY